MDISPLKIIDEIYGGEPELKKRLLKHSLQVRQKALDILDGTTLVLDRKLVETGALLHDIGIFRCCAPGILCRGREHYIAHGVIGAQILREYGQIHGIDLEPAARICERHTGSGLTVQDITAQDLPLPHRDFLPETLEEKLICLADKFFSKSGSMEEKTFSAVRSSMSKFGGDSLARFDDLAALFSVSGKN